MKHKILLVLLLSSMACITATAQKVSMDFRQVKLAKVFDAITQQTGLTVAYSRPTVNPDKLVTVRADEEELAHVLDRLLAGMGVTYEISGKKVYLKAKAASEATHQSGKVKKISGVIVDEKGEPVIGASIAVKGTSLGTITNVDGEYTLMGVPEKAEVVISFIGYKTRTFSAGDKALANITLKEDSELLEEVVVGVVGVLQLEVLEYRLRNEYNVDIRMQTLPYEHLRWIMNDPDELDPKTLDLTSDTRCIEDLKGNHLLLFGSPWSINWAEQHNEQLKLSEFGNLTF